MSRTSSMVRPSSFEAGGGGEDAAAHVTATDGPDLAVHRADPRGPARRPPVTPGRRRGGAPSRRPRPSASSPARRCERCDIGVKAIGAMALTWTLASAPSSARLRVNPHTAGLGRGVARRTGRAEQTGVGRRRHDPAVPLACQVRPGGAGDVEGARQVDGEHAVQHVGRHLPEVDGLQRAGVVDDDVDATERLASAPSIRPAAAAGPATSAPWATAVPPAAGDRRRGVLCRLAVEVVDDHRRTTARRAARRAIGRARSRLR